MKAFRLLALLPLVALSACDTTSWGTNSVGTGTNASGVDSVPCTSLTKSPPDYSKLTLQQRDRVESEPTPMC